MLSVHVGIASMRQFQRVPTTYDTEKRRETILKSTLIKYNAHYLCLFTTCQAADRYYNTIYVANCVY